MLEKPHLTRSISSISGSTKASGKRGRKKAEAITDLAAAQYRTEKEDNPQPPSVADFLTKKSPEATPDDTEPSAKKRKRQTKSKDTTRGKKVKNHKGDRKASKEKVDEPTKPLSPQSAIRRTNEQQIIFGTFSQLTDGKVDALPDTEVSGLQKSSSSSNHRISPLAKVRSPHNTLAEELLHREFDANGRIKAKNALKREGLWKAASTSDELADIDFVDLSKTPKIDNKRLEVSLPVEQKTRRKNGQGRMSGSVTPKIGDSVEESTTPPTKKRKKDPLKRSTEVSGSIPLADGSSTGAPDIIPSPSKGKKSKGKPTEPTAGSPQSNKTTKGKRATSPAKSKGKKRAKSPRSPPTRKSRRSKSPSVFTRWPSASPSGHKADKVHSYISQAITAEYRSTNDIVNSWHYKILTYEPIILEDFTIWLNKVGFGNVGMDDEVSPFVVKEWAEARSVINVWRETQKGTDRKRF